MNKINEIAQSLVAENGIINTPVLIFSSNGLGTGWKQGEWRGCQREYLLSLANGTLIDLNCSHYVHDIEYEKIAEDIKTYLNDIQ